MSTGAVQSRYNAAPSPSGLADVVDLILDKGLVIDLYVRVSLVGIELLTIDARIVVASVDTYLRFAEAVGRLNIAESDDKESLPELMQDMTSGGARSKTRGALDAAKDKFDETFGGDDEEQEQQEEPERQPARRSRRRRQQQEGEE